MRSLEEQMDEEDSLEFDRNRLANLSQQRRQGRRQEDEEEEYGEDDNLPL